MSKQKQSQKTKKKTPAPEKPKIEEKQLIDSDPPAIPEKQSNSPPKDEKSESFRKNSFGKVDDGFARYANVLDRIPNQFESSGWGAFQRLVLTLPLTVLSFHILSMLPVWALPFGWLFAALAMCAFFEIGSDCANQRFFPYPLINDLFGFFFLMTLFQPISTWNIHKPNIRGVGWRGTLAKSWRSLCNTFSLSHLFVLIFASAFFPLMIYYFGWWGLTKYWLVPFILFHIAMEIYVKAGSSLEVNSLNPLGLFLAIRSYLRFQRNVPTYRVSEAMDVVQRMWNRASLDSCDHPAATVQELLENPAYYSLRLGYLSSAMAYSLMEMFFLPILLMWIFFAYKHEIITYDLVSSLSAVWQAVSIQDLLSRANWALLTVFVIALFIGRKLNPHRSVYLVDFVTYTPTERREELTATLESFKEIQRKVKNFTPESLDFMDKLIDRTGLSNETYFPPSIMQATRDNYDRSMSAARKEAEIVIFGSIDQLLASTGVKPKEIDILVVNCSLFCPTPSLASMIVNKYKLRQDIQSYNLGGMGCSAGVISIHLAKDLLQTYPNSRALVVSTENITQNWYHGNERSMLLSNCLFRMGGAAILLSNKRGDRTRSKYKLRHTVRTHTGALDQSYNAVYQDHDPQGHLGVRLDKDLVKVAGEALKRNITVIGALILPWTEQLKYFGNLIIRKFKPKVAPYLPNFRTCIQHFCIHAGGRAVLETIEKALRLNPKDLEASRFVLARYGNTSSSSIWYELAYLEKTGAIRAGDNIFQIAFGSGFKCNSAVWKAL